MQAERRFPAKATAERLLGPMLREYILSEAMVHLGVPTTRALAVVTTGQYVQRTEREQGAILTRVAESHLRVGTFEWLASIGGDMAVLLDYAIERHDPDLLHAPDRGGSGSSAWPSAKRISSPAGWPWASSTGS